MSISNKFFDMIEIVQRLKPWEVPTNADVHNHIVNLYNTIYGSGGEAFAERESRYINRIITDEKSKWGVTPLSVFLAYVDLAVKNLTLEPGAQALCYLLNRSVKSFAKTNKNELVEQWESRCYIAITGYGEILLRQRAGQIRHCDTPTIVYAGDTFTYTESEGRKKVSYGLNLAHDITKPIACFMKITRVDGSIDYAIILAEAWGRLEKFSLKQNERTAKDKEKATANALYTSGAGNSIDPGFLIAKCVKHAFKNYPRLPIGKASVLEANLSDEEAHADTESYDYDDAEQESFAGDANISDGVSINPQSDDSLVEDDGTF